MGNVHMEATQINYREGNKKMSVAEAIKNAGNTGLAHTADIAPEFSATSAYNAGDFVYKDGTLYQFTANHAAGAWSTDDTQAATVGGKITSLEGDVDNLSSVKANQITIAPTFSAETAYDPGDLVYYNGLSYRCVNSHEGAWDADDFAATTISNELSSLMSGLIDLSDIVNRQNQMLDLTNVSEPSTNVKRYTFAGVDLLNKVLAIFVKIASYGYIDNRIVMPISGYNCKYIVDITDDNSYHWGAVVTVEHNHIDVTTLSSSYLPSDHPMLLDAVVIVNHF